MKVRIRHEILNQEVAGRLLLVTEEDDETYSGWIQDLGQWTRIPKSHCLPPYDQEREKLSEHRQTG